MGALAGKLAGTRLFHSPIDGRSPINAINILYDGVVSDMNIAAPELRCGCRHHQTRQSGRKHGLRGLLLAKKSIQISTTNQDKFPACFGRLYQSDMW